MFFNKFSKQKLIPVSGKHACPEIHPYSKLLLNLYKKWLECTPGSYARLQES